jgi:hypothetical protein
MGAENRKEDALESKPGGVSMGGEAGSLVWTMGLFSAGCAGGDGGSDILGGDGCRKVHRIP